MANEYDIIKDAQLPKKKYDKRLKPNSSRSIAKANGEISYISEPCKNGHKGVRYTKSGRCVHCIGVHKLKRNNPRQRSDANHALALSAAARGQTTYWPHIPCKQGHSLRYVNSNACVECDKLLQLKYKVSKQYARITKIYGLSKESYLSLVRDQNNRCKLCNAYEKDHFQLHVDHCHETGKVRGLLCPLCNQGIGLMKHDSTLLRKAAIYCEKSK